MREHHTKENGKIETIPFDRLINEGQSQQKRVVEEVMEQLFQLLPIKKKQPYTFTLSDGTTCWIKAFSRPKIRSNGELGYGFDVVFSQPYPLNHLEFIVRCSGWERSMNIG